MICKNTQMQKQILQSSIQKKSKQIQLLQVVSRAIQKFQEKKNQKNEEMTLNDLENSIKAL